MMQQQSDNFSGIPRIAKFPGIVASETDQAKSVVDLTATYKIPDESLALAGIKQMCVGIYLWHLSIWKAIKWYPSSLPTDGDVARENDQTRKLAETVLKDVGAGGTAIDPAEMVSESSALGYRSRPWENDAFYCGEVAGQYWRYDQAPDGLSDSQCSRAYAFLYSVRQRIETAAAGK